MARGDTRIANCKLIIANCRLLSANCRWLSANCALLALTAVVGVAAQERAEGQRPGTTQPSRDTSAFEHAPPIPQGLISGRVVAADDGRPIKRARVFASATEVPGGRGVLTDDSGGFAFIELPAGRYTISASKPGFVSLSYGQRRPFQPGTPLQLADGQQMKGVDFQLPRGSVIGGRVLDQDGDVMPGVTIRALRYVYLQGNRRLTAEGSAQTDDRGEYRIWGLPPGSYFVNAVPRVRSGPVAVSASGLVGGVSARPDSNPVNYAPSYYPGVDSMQNAKPVNVGLEQQSLDINFDLAMVSVSRVAGLVTHPDGTPVAAGDVTLSADTSEPSGNRIGVNFGSTIQWDGAFSVNGVPPGRYILRARGDDSDVPQFASARLTLDGHGIDDMVLMLSEGATIGGAIRFLPGATPPPDPTDFRITAPPADQDPPRSQTSTRPDETGRFVITGVPVGAHYLRPGRNPRGWMLKSVTEGGHDITDIPLELRSGESVGDILMTFTDRLNEIDGTVSTDLGAPIPELTVLAFPTDSAFWHPQSRQIMTARPDQSGNYRIRGLPSGEYFLVTIDPGEEGEWFDPAYLDRHVPTAARLTLGDGETKRRDFKLAR